jgi:membrane associated rhomboid family serine protease
VQSLLALLGPRAPISGREFVDLFGLVPRLTLLGGRVWQPVTYLFLHGGLWHLLLNMLMLWMFGSPVERAWGSRRFLRYYFVCGLGAAALTCLVARDSRTIGASGAVLGLLVAYGMLWPRQVVLIWGIIPMQARTLVWISAAVELYSLIFSGGGMNIAYGAHVGGMLIGYLWLKRAWRPRELWGELRWRFRRRRFRVVDRRDDYPFH